MSTIVFTDLDGVICIAANPDGTGEVVISQLCRNLARLATRANALVVISSDWRLQNTQREIMRLLPEIPLELMHQDCLDRSIISRWPAICRWLEEHPEVTKYIIIDDCVRLFEGAPEHITGHLVLCNGREGLTGERVGAALRHLDGRPINEQPQFAGGDANYDADL